MKKLTIALLLITIFTPYIYAQNFGFQKKFKTDANTNKNEIIKKCIKLVAQQNFNYNFNTSSLNNEENKTETKEPLIYTEEGAQKLEKELKNNFTDAQKNLDISLIYMELQNREKFEKHILTSIENCENAIKSMPDSLEYYLIEGQILTMFNRTADLAVLYEEALKNVKKNEDVKSVMMMLVITYLNLGEYGKTDNILNEGIKKFPDNEEFYFYKIIYKFFELTSTKSETELNTLFETKTIDEIFDFKTFEDAIKKYPKNYKLKATYFMTREYVILISISSTLEDFAEIKKYEHTKFNKKEIKKIRKFYKKQLKKQTKNRKALLYYSLGTLEVIDGNLDKSIEIYETALNTNFSKNSEDIDEEIYTNLVAISILNGDTTKSIKHLEKKIQKYNNTSDYNLLASTYLSQNKPDKAINSLQKAYEKGYYNVGTFLGFAIANLQKKSPVTAREMLNEIYKYQPEESNAQIITGVSYFLDNNVEEAYKYFEKSNKTNPNNKRLNEIASLIFEKL